MTDETIANLAILICAAFALFILCLWAGDDEGEIS